MKLQPPVALIRAPQPATWDALVAEADGAAVFHTSAWAQLWTAEWPRSRWEALVVPDGAGYVGGLGFIVREGALGRTVLSMPYATYGGPLVRRGHPDPSQVRRQLLEAYTRLVRGGRIRVSELTWCQGSEAEVPRGLPVHATFTHVRALERDFGALLRSLPHSVRSRVRQAEDHRLTLGRIVDPDGVRAYHDLAVRTMRRRGGRPKSLSLYLRILERLVPAGLARYDLVHHQGAAIAGSLHLLHRGVGTNWLTASDEKYWPLRPNHWILAAVMGDLCSEGFREYDFGGSPPDAAGLIRFKEDWGAIRRPVLQLKRNSLAHRLLGAVGQALALTSVLRGARER